MAQRHVRLWLHRQYFRVGLIYCWIGLFRGFVDKNKKANVSFTL